MEGLNQITFFLCFLALSAKGGKRLIMGTKYLIWKDKNCQGVDPEWLFLSGKEFFDFIKSEQSIGRFFFKQPALDVDDDNIVIECTKEQYKAMKKEKRRAEYLLEQQRIYETVSVYSFEDEDNVSLYDKQASNDKSVEELIETIIMSERLREIFNFLSSEENELIKLYYFSDNSTERSIADKMGISQQLLNQKKKSIIFKLKKFFCQI